MNRTDIPPQTAAEEPGGEQFSDLVRRILDLPSSDQQRLHAMLAAMLGPVPGAPIADRVAYPAVTNEDEAEDEYREIELWLASIDHEVPAKQVRLIDEVGTRVVFQASLDLLSERRGKLLDNHPPLAVRGAVTRLATESPVQLALGVLGLAVGIVSFAVWAFQKIF
jgi:hypothetical protein